MSYAAPTATLDLLPGLPQTSTSAGYSAIITMITDHITRADSVINAKIVRRFDVSGLTSTAVPPLLRTISQDMASYYTMRSRFSSDNQNLNEWTDKFNEAISILDEIQDGSMDLVDTAGSLIAEKSTSAQEMVESNTQDYQPFFDEDNSTSWKVDNDKLDSIWDKR